RLGDLRARRAQRGDSGGIDVVNDQREATLRQVERHRSSHVAEPDESDGSRHVSLLDAAWMRNARSIAGVSRSGTPQLFAERLQPAADLVEAYADGAELALDAVAELVGLGLEATTRAVDRPLASRA